mgnify:CR=1 FL=1
MEKLAKYQAIVREVLQAEKIDRPDSDLRDVIISDPQSGHYQLLRTGWESGRFLHDIVFHFHIKPDGKIWLLQNNTDIPITDQLLKKGVPTTDIVLGFHPPELRKFTDYAEA